MSEQLAAKQKQAVGLTVTILAVVVVFIIGMMLWKYANTGSDVAAVLEQNQTVLFDAPRMLPSVNLTRHDGSSFSTDSLKGQWDIVNFGYTYCPDICPTNMADLNIAYKSLTELGLADQIQVWMISVDPQRDTPEQLAQYVPYFNENFIGVTGEIDQISTFATQLSAVFYPEGSGEGYTVAHSDNMAIVDPQGHFVALMRPPHRPGNITAVMQALMIE
ncbi:MAG: SCO family protein [Reinekea sp.]|jgi:protein SCO1